MKRKVLASILCLVFLFSMAGMAMGAPQNGYYVNGHRYELTLTKADAAYFNFLADMKAISWDYSQLIIVNNNQFAEYQDAIDEGNILSVLQPNAHQQVGSLIPSNVIPISNDGTEGASEPVSNTVEDIAVTGVTLDQETLTLTAGGTTGTLLATVAPADATNKNVTWTSSNESVATVAAGVVTPVAAGSATITVTTADGSFDDTCAVTVEAAVVQPTINPESFDLNKNAPVNDIPIDITWNDATQVNDVILRIVTSNGPLPLMSLNDLEAAEYGTFYTVEGNVLTIKKEMMGLFEMLNYPLSTIPDGFPINLDILFDVGQKTFLITIVDGETPTVAVTGVTLDQETLALTAGGDTATLAATVAPANATNKNVSWTSSNQSVATVVDGVVTPVAAGSATITVTTADGSFDDTCVVTIEAATVAVTGVTLDKDTLTLTAGEATGTLTATVAPANATNKNVSWTSSDEDVATVVDGVVTPVAAGSATITVTTADGSITDTCEVTVEAAVVQPTINPESFDLNKNAPVNDIPIDITWNDATQVNDVILRIVTSNGPLPLMSLNDLEAAEYGTFYTVEGNVLTIKKEMMGLFEMLNYPLSTIPDGFPINLDILFDVGQKTFLITIVDGETPTVAVTGVTLDQETLALTAGGDTATLAATVAPANATNKNVSWTSSNQSVATVVDGVVTPVAAGSATITVTTADGSFDDTCVVTIEAATVAVTGVTLDKDTLTLTAGEATGTLTATVAPANATNKNVSWTSSDEDVATVVDGVVTPVAAGSATITVTTADGSITDTCVVTVETAAPASAIAAIEAAIAKYTASTSVASAVTFTGNVTLDSLGERTVHYVKIDPTTISTSKAENSNLAVKIQTLASDETTTSVAAFPLSEIIAGLYGGASLVSGGTLDTTTNPENYIITLSNVDCPQSLLNIIAKAANVNSTYKVTFTDQKLECKILVSKTTGRVVSINDIKITGNVKVKVFLSTMNGTNLFESSNPMEINYTN